MAQFETPLTTVPGDTPVQSRKWPLVFSLVLHPFIIGQPFRLRALRRALAHIMKSRDQLWITTPRGIAAHFEKVVPPPK